MTSREWLTAIGLGLVVSVVIRIFFPVGLAGPIAWGGFAGARRMSSLWPVVVSAVAGIGAVLVDFAVKREHVGFHLALTFTMCALAWSAWSIVGRLTHADHRG
jgi:hypothetical protein